MKDAGFEHTTDPHGTPDPTDAPSLMRDLVHQASRLVRNEIEFAKREVGQKITRAGVGIGMMLVAVVLVLTSLDILSAAATAAIVEAGLPVSVASILVGGAALLLAAILFMVGKSRLSPKSLTPDRSIDHLRRDIQTIKETSNV